MADWQETRGAIVSVAREVFARFGFKKTTVADVAHAANKAKSSIYHYFTDKMELFWAVVAEERRLLREEVSRGTEAGKTPLEDLRAYATTRASELRKLPSLWDVIRRESFADDPAAERARGEYHQDQIALASAILRKWVAKGVLASRDLEKAAKGLVTAMGFLDYESPDRLGEGLDEMIGLFLGGLRVR